MAAVPGLVGVAVALGVTAHAAGIDATLLTTAGLVAATVAMERRTGPGAFDRLGLRRLAFLACLSSAGWVAMAGGDVRPRSAGARMAFRTGRRSADDSRHRAALGDLPLSVVIGQRSDNARGVGHELQLELRALSRAGTKHRVPGADHGSLLHEREHAEQVAEIIVAMAPSVRPRLGR